MKRSTITYLLLTVLLSLGIVACQNTTSEENKSDSTTVNSELKKVQDKAQDLKERIKNSTYAERKNLQDDIQYFVDDTNELLSDMERDSELEQSVEDVVHKLKEQNNMFVEELKEFGNTTEEQWEESTSKLESNMDQMGQEIEDFLSGNG